VVSTHHVITVVVTAAVTVGLTVALMLAFVTTNTSTATTKASAPVSHIARADSTLCKDLVTATPGSPAAFRIVEEIQAQGSC
jgi:hypothetical protein